MKKDILTILLISTIGFGAWMFMSSHDVTDGDLSAEQIVQPEMLDGASGAEAVDALENPPTATLETAPTENSHEASTPKNVAALPPAPPAGADADAGASGEVTDGPALSDLEREIMEVLANAHAVHDNYQRADAEIETQLDIQVREALERRAITAREAPEYRDYLRQIAIEDRSREQQDYEPDTPAVGGIFADRSFVTEE